MEVMKMEMGTMDSGDVAGGTARAAPVRRIARLPGGRGRLAPAGGGTGLAVVPVLVEAMDMGMGILCMTMHGPCLHWGVHHDDTLE